MNEPALALSPAKYYDEAKKMLEEKDILGFMSKIGTAIELALVGNDEEMLAEATYLQAEGLFFNNHHKKALECINLALQYNSFQKAFTLKNRRGIVKGYLGHLDEAIDIFKGLLSETGDLSKLAVLYTNIAWVNLSLGKNPVAPEKLKEVKDYLDLTQAGFEDLPNTRKWRIYNSYSVYYYYQNDLDQAIDMLKAAMPFCEEKDLPYIYNNLAETYLKYEDGDHSALIDEYTQKSEIIGTKYNDNVNVGRTFYVKAMAELKDEQLFKALDTFYMAFEHFRRAEAYPLAFECLAKINNVMNEYKIDCLRALNRSVKTEFNGTSYYEKL